MERLTAHISIIRPAFEPPWPHVRGFKWTAEVNVTGQPKRKMTLDDILRAMYDFPDKSMVDPGRPKKIRVSPWFFNEIRIAASAAMLSVVTRDFDQLFGVPLEFDETLPPVRPIIQHDRFCEYDARDMVWAEPLGLASWKGEEVHAVLHFEKVYQ